MEAVKTEKRRLTRDAILSVEDLGSSEVYVEQWGGSVLARGLSAGERSRFAMMFEGDKAPENTQAMLVQMGTIDENGEQLFSEADVPELSKKSGQALEVIAAKIMALSGMTTSIEDAEKN